MGFIALSTSAMAPTRLFPAHRITIRALWHDIAGARGLNSPYPFAHGAGARDHIELWDGLWDFLRL